MLSEAMSQFAGTQTRGVPLWERFRRAGAGPNAILRAFEIVTPPVPIERIAHGLQIEVKEDAVLDVAGTLFLLDDVPVVTIRASDARVRQRFTLAHEIGHLMLHERGQHFRDKNFLSGDPREIEANRYAAELLMPSWMIEPAASKYRADSGILARLFDVSEQAMNIRLQMIAGFR